MTAARGRIALVTGANRGIGLETSRQLLAAGLRVAMTGRDPVRIERARHDLGAAADGAIAVQLDVTDTVGIRAARETVEARLGRVDVLVNNAAVLLFEHDPLLEIPADGFRDTLEANLLGVIEVCRTFVPAMATRGYGRVVNVSSGAGQLATMSTYAPAYAIAKTALNAFTRILAGTYRDRGVLANAADPGWVRTQMGGPSAPRSVAEGADTIVWLATLAAGGPTGGFFRDRRPIAW